MKSLEAIIKEEEEANRERPSQWAEKMLAQNRADAAARRMVGQFKGHNAVEHIKGRLAVQDMK